MQQPYNRANREAYFRTTPPWPPLDARPGDRVGYTRRFLVSIGVTVTDPMWQQLGTVVETRDPFVVVRWDDASETTVHAVNLAIPGPNLRWCE